MNKPESGSESGCSSCKRQENGDSNTETDRPLKKARFAWQVKGKYHLKNDIPKNIPSKTMPESSSAGSFSENEGECKKICSDVNSNLEILGDLFEQDLCTLDSVTKSDQQILPNRKLSEDKLPYPRPISRENINVNIESDYDINSKDELEDQCIASWQMRQLTKCLVDNTLNSLIDGWMRGPLVTDVDDELNNDDSIENEGILMAISAHGLQNTTASSDFTGRTATGDSSNTLSEPTSPLTEDVLDSSTRFRSKDCFLDKISENNTSQELLNYAYSPSDESTKNEDFDTLNNNYSDTEDSHYDFLDTAVSFAIQYKGLTSYGTEYG